MNKNDIVRDRTVDPKEVAYYTKLADLWWDETGPFWPLHRLNRFRVEYLREILGQRYGCNPIDEAPPLAGLSVLDIGCGGGILSESMTRLGAQVCGVDVVEKNICIAQLHAEHQHLNIDYQLITVESLAGQGTRYDVVLNMEVVEHVANLPDFMRSCASLVRPGGLMVVATINRTIMSFLFAIVGAEYVLRWLPKGTHQWKSFRRPREIRKLFLDNGFAVLDQTGVRINPITKSFRLSRIDAVNYMMVAEKQVATL
jgi:2-polyprenyl-6-hydroxyphenyl methylase/3-demethylubiquinone-9 3-methyltransferase